MRSPARARAWPSTPPPETRPRSSRSPRQSGWRRTPPRPGTRPKAGTSHPGLVLIARPMAAEGAERDAARKEILASQLDLTEVHDAAGRLLLAKGDAKGAVLHCTRALELNAGNVRARVALGDY